MRKLSGLVVLLFLLPSLSFAEAVGGKDGLLKQRTHAQIDSLMHEELIKKINIINTHTGPYTATEEHYHFQAQGCNNWEYHKRGYHKHAGARDHTHDFSHCPRVMHPPRPSMAAPKAKAAPVKPQVSSTNVQEQGVDEADFVKTDGRYLYAVENKGPAAGIRVYDTQHKGDQLKQISAIGFGTHVRNLSGIYLLPEQKKLVVIGSDLRRGYQGSTYVITVDTTDPSKLRTIRQTKLQASIKTSRRVGNRLYMVLNSSNFSLPSTYRHFQTVKPATVTEIDSIRQEITGEIKKWSITNSIPYYSTRGQSGLKRLIASGDFYIIPNSANRSNLTTLLSIDLMAKNFDFESLGWFGDQWGSTVYVSQKAVYMTSVLSRGSVRPRGAVPPGFYSQKEHIAKTLNKGSFPTDLESRLIHKFAFKGKGFDYRGSGAVLGQFKRGELSTFQFDEDAKGNLRVVTSNNRKTSKSNDPAGASPVVLTALAEHPQHKQLVTLSRIPNKASPKALGKPGESLYGARLFNDYAYFVTFKRTDPLYVVDMRNPKRLKVTGELFIPGFSDYLHAVGDGLLVGVGKEATNTGRVQGLKLSLFDIRNPNKPTEIHKIEVGAGGTDSPANRNHHAFTSLAIRGTSTTRIALPISVVDAKTYNSKNGLHRFEVDRKARRIKHLGAMKPLNGNNVRSWSANDRSIIIGNKLYYYHNGHFWKGAW